jgi:hypothetical protein
MKGNNYILSNSIDNILPQSEPAIFGYCGPKAFTSEAYSVDNFDTTVTHTTVLRSDVVLVRKLQQHSNLLSFARNINFALQHNFIHPDMYRDIHSLLNSSDKQLMDEISLVSSNSPVLWRRLLLVLGQSSTWDFFKHDALERNMELGELLYSIWLAKMNVEEKLCRLKHERDQKPATVERRRQIRTRHLIHPMGFNPQSTQTLAILGAKLSSSRVPRHKKEPVCKSSHSLAASLAKLAGHPTIFCKPQSFGPTPTPPPIRPLPQIPQRHVVIAAARFIEEHAALEKRSDLLIANHAKILLRMNKEPKWSIPVEPTDSNWDSEVGHLRGLPSHQHSCETQA